MRRYASIPRHKRYARKPGTRSDVGLPAITRVNQALGTDHLIIAKSEDDKRKVGANGECVGLTARDPYSGLGYVYPSPSKQWEKVYTGLKHYKGPVWKRSPNLYLKADGAREIAKAADELGWYCEPSPGNRDNC